MLTETADFSRLGLFFGLLCRSPFLYPNGVDKRLDLFRKLLQCAGRKRRGEARFPEQLVPQLFPALPGETQILFKCRAVIFPRREQKRERRRLRKAVVDIVKRRFGKVPVKKR